MVYFLRGSTRKGWKRKERKEETWKTKRIQAKMKERDDWTYKKIINWNEVKARSITEADVILIPKTIGNRKRECASGCARGIDTTWENLQIEKHKSVRWPQRTPSSFVLFDLQIFSCGVYPWHVHIRPALKSALKIALSLNFQFEQNRA